MPTNLIAREQPLCKTDLGFWEGAWVALLLAVAGAAIWTSNRTMAAVQRRLRIEP